MNMEIEPTDQNFDLLWRNGTERETFGWVLNFDGISDEWNAASFWVPEWARGHEAQINLLWRIRDKKLTLQFI